MYSVASLMIDALSIYDAIANWNDLVVVSAVRTRCLLIGFDWTPPTINTSVMRCNANGLTELTFWHGNVHPIELLVGVEERSGARGGRRGGDRGRGAAAAACPEGRREVRGVGCSDRLCRPTTWGRGSRHTTYTLRA